MKKFFIIANVLLLATACGKKSPQVLPSSSPNPPSQNQAATSSPAAAPAASSTQAAAAPKPTPLTLSVYSDPAGVFKINYISDFRVFTAADLRANISRGENTSACGEGDSDKPLVCFVFKGQPYKNTNLTSAALSVRVRADKADLGKCGDFTADNLGLGHLGNPVVINGIVFVTAVGDHPSGGTNSQTRVTRGFHNKTCYELDESINWADAGSFNPPRQEANRGQIWFELDGARGGFRFAN